MYLTTYFVRLEVHFISLKNAYRLNFRNGEGFSLVKQMQYWVFSLIFSISIPGHELPE